MAFTYIVKNSTLGGKIPSAAQLQPGELALNLTDQKLYSKDTNGKVFEIGKEAEIDKGTTGERPTAPIRGDIYYDTTIDTLLYWDGSQWVEVGKIDLSYQSNGNGAGTVTNTAGTNATIPVATNTTAGLFTGTEKQKLDGITAGADKANNGTITLTQNGSFAGSFSVNQANNQTINIESGGDGVTKITAGTNVTISPTDGTGNVTINAAGSSNFSGKYEDLENKPTIGDGEIVIKQGGAEKGRFNVNQTNGLEINLTEGGSGGGGGFSGDYNDLNNKPTIGNGRIKIVQGGTEKGSFTVNQENETTINIDAGGGGGTSGLTETESPLSDNGTKVKLEYARGLTVVSNKLETNLGDGLTFDGDKIKVLYPEQAVISYEPKAAKTSGSDSVEFYGAGFDNPGGRKEIRFDNLPRNMDGFVTITTWRYIMQPNANTDYPTPLAVMRLAADFYADVSGRNCQAQTSDSNSITLWVADTIAWGGGSGASGHASWRHVQYATRIDEWTCNDGTTEGIRFNFGIKNVDHNKLQLTYNAGCRVALLPYDRNN